jgi:hypothetical protein
VNTRLNADKLFTIVILPHFDRYLFVLFDQPRLPTERLAQSSQAHHLSAWLHGLQRNLYDSADQANLAS